MFYIVANKKKESKREILLNTMPLGILGSSFCLRL